MKFIGDSVETTNLGYFGIRRCENCGGFKDVDLVEIKKVFRFCFLNLKTYAVKRFLVCHTCSACFEVSPELWEFYKTYNSKRMGKQLTDEVVSTLTQINNDLVKSGTIINLDDNTCHVSLDIIHSTLSKKYGHPEYLEELISVFFSGCNKEKPAK